MNTYKLFFALFMGVMGVIGYNLRSAEENKLKIEPLKQGRKTVLIEPLMLPIYLAAILMMLLIMGGISLVGAVLADLGLLFVYISVYYAVVLLLLPLFRQIFNARACATLWLVPALLYLMINYLINNLSGYDARPYLIITVPRQWLFVFLWIWAVGFAGLLLWQVLSHFSFRSVLLKNSEKLTDTSVLSLWYSESRRHGVKAEIPVVVSDAVSTPLTIGCFERTMRLVLPKQSYTDEDIRLIFRHELRHILRVDTRVKLFMGFCAAICWFNPLAWIARRKAAEDLELSCDEAVLMDADESMRRKYAELLLKNAGNGRGYTTCLSASANSLRYRLRKIVRPAKRLSGSVIVGFALFAIVMSLGTVAIADSSGTVQELIFDKAPSGIVIHGISTDKWNDELFARKSVYGWKEDELSEYIASLRVKQIYAGNYVEDNTRQLSVGYVETIDGETASITWFELCDGVIFANIPYDEYGEIAFILDDQIDWEYIDTLLDFDAENPDPAPWPPDMMMCFDEIMDTGEQFMHASRTVTTVRTGEAAGEINKNWEGIGVGGVEGISVTQVQLSFSYAPEGGYKVKVENWERTASYIVSSSELADDILLLAPYSAHYTVYGTFATVRDTVYEVEFYFDVGLPEE